MDSDKISGVSFVGLMHVVCWAIFVFSVLSLVDQYHWLLELPTHFKVQYFILSALLIILFSFFKSRTYMVISCVTLLINAVYLAPYFVHSKSKTKRHQAQTLKLFHSNVLSSNKDYQQVVENILTENPDIIGLQEVDNSWINHLMVIREHYPFAVEVPRPDNFGIALYSKFPITNSDVQSLGSLGLPSIEAQVVVNNEPIYLLLTHPLPPVSQQHYDARNAQLKDVAKRIKEIDGAKIVLGDLNTTVWTSAYKTLEADTGLRNASKGFGIQFTWPTNIVPLMISIDHCLVTDNFAVIDVSSKKLSGSDHASLVVELEL